MTGAPDLRAQSSRAAAISPSAARQLRVLAPAERQLRDHAVIGVGEPWIYLGRRERRA